MKLEKIKEKIAMSSKTQRREGILLEMETLVDSGKNCLSCEGHCCTFVYNSMQVTPLEALELYEFLLEKNMINSKLIRELELCVEKYRLDREFNLGKGRELRRLYTCPFFNAGPRGCSIEPESKPYGCLAFNPLERSVKSEGSCTSYSEVLSQREDLNKEDPRINSSIANEMKLSWKKRSIPQALLDFIKVLN